MTTIKTKSHILNTKESYVRNSDNTEDKIPLITSPLIPETRVGAKFFNLIKWLVKELLSSFINALCQPFWQALVEFVQQIDLAAISDFLQHWPSLFPFHSQLAIVGLVMVSPLALTAVVNVFAPFRLPSPPRWLKSLSASLSPTALATTCLRQAVLAAISTTVC